MKLPRAARGLATRRAVLVACLARTRPRTPSDPSPRSARRAWRKRAAFALIDVAAAAYTRCPRWRQVVAGCEGCPSARLANAPAGGGRRRRRPLALPRSFRRPRELADGTSVRCRKRRGCQRARAARRWPVAARRPASSRFARNFAAAFGDGRRSSQPAQLGDAPRLHRRVHRSLLFTLVSTPESLKVARAERRRSVPRRSAPRASRARRRSRLARRIRGGEAEYVDGADATARANDASSARRVEATSRSTEGLGDDGGGDDNHRGGGRRQETEVITTTIIKRRTRKVNTYIDR